MYVYSFNVFYMGCLKIPWSIKGVKEYVRCSKLRYGSSMWTGII